MSVKVCAVNRASGKPCPDDAEFIVISKCKCPSPRSETATCGRHRDQLLNGQVTCNGCKTDDRVISWDRLKKELKPAAVPEVDPRIGDVQRAEVFDVLSGAYSSGVLTLEEFNERTDAAQVARVQSALLTVIADLPEGQTAHPVQPTVSKLDLNRFSLYTGFILGVLATIAVALMISVVT